MLWLIKFNHRKFVMSISRLNEFSGYEPLEYCNYISNSTHDIEKIYVRACRFNDRDNFTDTNWYELDYILTIPHNVRSIDYDKFIKDNDSVNKLNETMNKHYSISPMIYKRMKSDYNCFRYLSLIFLIIFFGMTLLIYNNI